MPKVVTRFAPSPTGPLHLGGARTALFNYLFTRREGGKIYLRIEDTDRERSKPEFEQNIFEGLRWLGLEFDNPEPVRQSARGAHYREALERLLTEGSAYRSIEERPGHDGGASQRREVIRFKNPGRDIVFNDLVRGEIKFNTAELGDFVIAKGLDEPLYHFAVVADDTAMGITHVIRGDDHIANTPRQILILEALKAERPIYAHIPLILAPDRSKLSKRRGAVAVLEYRQRGYLPSALVNYLALLGWHPSNEQEVFALDELIKSFELTRVQKGGAIFNQEKLNWLNREHLKGLSPTEFFHAAAEFIPSNHPLAAAGTGERVLLLAPIINERISNFGELNSLLQEGEFAYFFKAPEYDRALLKDPAHLPAVRKIVSAVPAGNFSVESLRTALMPYADREGRATVLWPWRVALSGRAKSVDPFTIAATIGQTETLARIDYALQK